METALMPDCWGHHCSAIFALDPSSAVYMCINDDFMNYYLAHPRVHTNCQRDCVPRYILPSLSLVPADPEEAVRVQYALVLAQLAAAANRFLLHLQQLANAQLHPDPSSPTLVSTLRLLLPWLGQTP